MTRLVGSNALGTPQEREPIQNYLRAIGVPQDKLTTHTNAMAYGEGGTSDHIFGSNDHMDIDALADITRSLPQTPSAAQMLDGILQATAKNPELRNLILKRTAAVSQQILNDLPAGTTNPNDPGVKRLADLAYGADLTTYYGTSKEITGENLVTAGSPKASMTMNKIRDAYSEKHTANQVNDDAMKAATHNIALAMTPKKEDNQEDTKAIEKNEKLLGDVNAKKINALEQQLHKVAGTSGMGRNNPAALSSALEKKYRGSLAFDKDGNLTCAPEIKAEMDKALQKADIKGDLINATNGQTATQPPPATGVANVVTPTQETHATQEPPSPPRNENNTHAATKKETSAQKAAAKPNAPAIDPKKQAAYDQSMILFMGQLGITGDAERKAFAEQHKGKLDGIQDFERSLQGFAPDGKRFTGPHSETAPTLANTPNLLVNDAAMTETQRAAVHTAFHLTTNRGHVDSAIQDARHNQGINGPAPWEKDVPPSSNRAAAGLQQTLDNAATLHPGNSTNRNVTGQESPQGPPYPLNPGECISGPKDSVCMDPRGYVSRTPNEPAQPVTDTNQHQSPPSSPKADEVSNSSQQTSPSSSAVGPNWNDGNHGFGDAGDRSWAAPPPARSDSKQPARSIATADQNSLTSGKGNNPPQSNPRQPPKSELPGQQGRTGNKGHNGNTFNKGGIPYIKVSALFNNPDA